MVLAADQLAGKAWMTAVTVAGLLLMITALLVWYLRRRACIRRVGSVHSRLRIAHSLREAGHFQQAEDAYRAMLGEHRRTTRDQGFALDAATGLYLTLLDRGDWPGAETLLREIVATYDPMSPPFRMGLLHARRELAHIRLHRGEYSDAVDELRAIERECHQRWGDTSRHTLRARILLAEALTAAGQAADAVPLARQVIECTDRVPGISPRQTVLLRIALAEALVKAGKLDDAERELSSAALTCEAAEMDTRTSLTFRSTLAAAATERGQHEDAMRHWAELLPEFAARHGEQHPWTLDIRYEMAQLRHRLGDSAAAVADHRAVLDARRRILGETHPHTIESRAALDDAARGDAATTEP